MVELVTELNVFFSSERTNLGSLWLVEFRVRYPQVAKVRGTEADSAAASLMSALRLKERKINLLQILTLLPDPTRP